MSCTTHLLPRTSTDRVCSDRVGTGSLVSDASAPKAATTTPDPGLIIHFDPFAIECVGRYCTTNIGHRGMLSTPAHDISLPEPTITPRVNNEKLPRAAGCVGMNCTTNIGRRLLPAAPTPHVYPGCVGPSCTTNIGHRMLATPTSKGGCVGPTCTTNIPPRTFATPVVAAAEITAQAWAA